MATIKNANTEPKVRAIRLDRIDSVHDEAKDCSHPEQAGEGLKHFLDELDPPGGLFLFREFVVTVLAVPRDSCLVGESVNERGVLS